MGLKRRARQPFKKPTAVPFKRRGATNARTPAFFCFCAPPHFLIHPRPPEKRRLGFRTIRRLPPSFFSSPIFRPISRLIYRLIFRPIHSRRTDSDAPLAQAKSLISKGNVSPPLLFEAPLTSKRGSVKLMSSVQFLVCVTLQRLPETLPKTCMPECSVLSFYED